VNPGPSDQEKIETICTIFKAGEKLTTRRYRVRDCTYVFSEEGELKRIELLDGKQRTIINA